MKILALGDIVGRPGRDVVVKLLPGLIREHDVSFVMANGENLAGGSGLTPETVNALFGAGVDCVTSGDHCYRQKTIIPMLETDARLLRPANFAKQAS
ncbi:MAG TPA: YmdB family metallophosphoesterase, partial [Planctomycetota bacterium]|nr:YmdB family metallophosphoesterase [Planctomycetota bacterium]